MAVRKEVRKRIMITTNNISNKKEEDATIKKDE